MPEHCYCSCNHKGHGQQEYPISEVLWVCILIESKCFVHFVLGNFYKGSLTFFYMHELYEPICNQNNNAFINVTLSIFQ